MRIGLMILSACLLCLVGIYRRLGELVIAMEVNSIAALELQETIEQEKPVMIMACKGIGMQHPGRN